jgi:hypothetical protein
MDKGSDSVGIRIWYMDTLNQTHYLSFGFSKNRWYGFKTRYWYVPYRLDSVKTVAISSSDTIQLVVQTIMQMNIENIPTQEEIPGFADTGSADDKAVYFLFEIATSRYYKLMHYNCPEKHSDKFGYHRKVNSIIQTISKKMVTMPVCPLN